MAYHGYAATEVGGALEKFEYEPTSLGPFDVEIRISHCGICHSDLHLIDNDWQMSTYPFIPGHEVVGEVTKLGDLATHLEVGQRVGVGWQRGACLHCENCLNGDENLCAESQATCIGNHGGFADYIQVDSRFAFPIPEALSSENIGPLMCGGITVYSPLVNYGVQPHHRVGVIGIGGLGHLALQFANKFGCEVTAFSSTPAKEEEAQSLGAHHFVNSKDADAMKKNAGQLDFIISTVFVDLDWQAYVNQLRTDGKLCFVGATSKPIQMPAMSLMFGRKSLCGSVIGGRPTINQMLDFAARHDVQAMTDVMPLDNVNDALQKLRDNQARYRMVLVNS